MQREKSQRFKVIGSNGIAIWFFTRNGCEQYIENRNDKKSRDDKYGAEYSIVEYSNQKKKTKRKKNEC